MRALVAAFCIMASACGASAQPIVHYQTRPGGGLILGSSLVDAQCRPLATVPTFVAARPRHGRIILSRGTDVQRTHPNPACNFRPVPALFMRYVANPGYVGRDAFSIGCRRSPPSDCRPVTIVVDMVP